MPAPPPLRLDRIPSPIGEILLLTQGEAIRALDFATHEDRFRRLLGPAAFIQAPGPHRAALAAYFAGELGVLDTLPTAPVGTAFQQAVWAALRGIPPGRPTTYARLAAAIGRPRAIRATGAANGANPVAIIHPCHRVIGADGALTGYGGGLWRKAWLLDHEARHA